MNIKKALLLLSEYNVPSHIIAHSYKVSKVGWVIANEIKEINSQLNINLIISSCLLHDITKYEALKTGEDHAETGGYLLKKLGYPEIGEIIESHVVIKNPSKLLLEKKILFYADKRVMHDKIVSLKVRYDDLLIRYGKTEISKQFIKKGYEFAKNIEAELFDNLKLKPEHILLLE